MEELSSGERDLVALGAAVGSNCALSVEHYIAEARNAGLTDRQIEEAVRLADGVCRVPAQKALDTALGLLSESAEPQGKTKAEAEETRADQEPHVPGGTSTGTGTASQPACADRKGRCC